MPQAKKGVLLVNTGSPRTPRTADVRRYLREFLGDKHVIDIPTPLRLALVHGIIAPLRGPKSAAMYESIWTPEGSPLLLHTRNLVEKLRAKAGSGFEAAWAMRYGDPSIAAAIDELSRKGVEELLLLPMFPQYALSTWATVVEEFERHAARFRKTLIAKPYYADAGYIKALAALLRESHTQGDYLLFSFHSLPLRHLTKADPARERCLKTPGCCSLTPQAPPYCYRAQALATADLLAGELGLTPSRYSLSFQSAMSGKWLGPSTEDELRRLAAAGESCVTLAAPGFTADNLETIEELSMRARPLFLEAGGERLSVAPSLNDSPKWVDGLYRLIQKNFESFEPA